MSSTGVLSIVLSEYRKIFQRRQTKYIAFSFSRDAASTGWSSIAIFSSDNSCDEVSIVLVETTSVLPHDARDMDVVRHTKTSVGVRQFLNRMLKASVVPQA